MRQTVCGRFCSKCLRNSNEGSISSYTHSLSGPPDCRMTVSCTTNRLRFWSQTDTESALDAVANLPGATKAREIIVTHALRYLDRLSQEAGNNPSLLHEMGVGYGKIGDVLGRPEFPNLGRSADALRSPLELSFEQFAGLVDVYLHQVRTRLERVREGVTAGVERGRNAFSTGHVDQTAVAFGVGARR